MSLKTSIAELAKRLKPSQRVSVVTGAGVSAASGIPTFRDSEGLWEHYSLEDLATPEAFARQPELVWKWYDWRRQRIATCQPNQAHKILAKWSSRYSSFKLLTQNIDGLHEKSGTKNVTRFHGSIWELRCTGHCETTRSGWVNKTVPLPNLPPRCPHCNSLARPGVVWFGEPIPNHVLDIATSAVTCDLFFVIGTSSVVSPAAGLVKQASARGAFTVEINPETTPVTKELDLALKGPAETILELIEAALLPM
jgi:NAD-dependent deacetylase